MYDSWKEHEHSAIPFWITQLQPITDYNWLIQNIREDEKGLLAQPPL